MNEQFKLCRNCIYCVTINIEKVKCKLGYFGNVPFGRGIIYTPEDFDCWEFEEANG